jgi:ketosteroid isomerase-like protein
MRGEPKPIEVTLDFLDAFAEAWNRHDVDAIMAAMTEDCVFEASAGVGVKGTVYDGQRQVRKGVEMSSRSFLTPDGADQSTLSRAIEA